MRIWSTDWYRDSDRQIQRITDRLNQLLEERSSPTVEPVGVDDMHTDAVADLASVDPLIPETPIGDPLDADRYEEASIVPIVGGRALEDIRAELVRLREETIHVEMPGADRTRGLLRKAMLDTLLRYRPTNPDEFRRRVPEALRTKTDPQQYLLYAGRVFDLLAEISEPEPPVPEADALRQFAPDGR